MLNCSELSRQYLQLGYVASFRSLPPPRVLPILLSSWGHFGDGAWRAREATTNTRAAEPTSSLPLDDVKGPCSDRSPVHDNVNGMTTRPRYARRVYSE